MHLPKMWSDISNFRDGCSTSILSRNAFVMLAALMARSGGRSIVLVQPEMEKRRSPLVSIPPFGRGFSRHGVFRSDGGWGGARTNPRAPVHRLDEPTGYPSAWLRPRSARFRFARQNHCSSATTCRFSTSSWPVIPPKPRPRQTQIVSVIALVTTVTVVSRKFGAEML